MIHKYTIIVFMGVLLAGCTAPTQSIARKALALARTQERAIISDLSNISKQGVVDKAVANVKLAIASENEAEAQAAVEKLATDFEKIGWLQLQHERAESLFRLAQFYIDLQQGIVDILLREYENYKKSTNKSD